MTLSQLNQPVFDSTPSIDWGLSLELASQKADLAKELLGMLVKDLEPTLKVILDIHDQGNVSQLRDELHRLYGATCYCGVPKLKRITERVQSAARREDTEQLGRLIQELTAEIESVLICYAEKFDN